MNYLRSLLEVLNHPLNKDSKLNTFLRIMWWKCNQALFHIPAVVQLTPEAQCICHPERSYAGQVIYTKFPECAEMKLIYDIVRSEDVFIDVGADIGTYSLIAASKIISGKVYAFEPTPQSLSILNKNICLNNFGTKIEVVPKLASDIDGTESFAFCRDSEVNHIAYLKKEREEALQQVESVKLDTFASARRLSHVDVIKIDVEGAEYKVLQGFESYLSSGMVGILLIEVNVNSELFNVQPADIFSFLGNRGYDIYRFDRCNRLCVMADTESFLRQTMNILAVHKSDEAQERVERYKKK